MRSVNRFLSVAARRIGDFDRRMSGAGRARLGRFLVGLGLFSVLRKPGNAANGVLPSRTLKSAGRYPE